MAAHIAPSKLAMLEVCRVRHAQLATPRCKDCEYRYECVDAPEKLKSKLLDEKYKILNACNDKRYIGHLATIQRIIDYMEDPDYEILH